MPIRWVSSIVQDVMTFEGYTPGDEYSIHQRGLFDVTQDGLPDAIVSANGSWFYIENISSPPVAACVGDLDDDGHVRVTDLLVLIANWGACEEG